MYWLITPLVAALWDARTGEIPDFITIPGIVVSFIYSLLLSPLQALNMLLFGVGGYLMYRYGMVGGGDVLLLLAISAFLPEIPLVQFYVLFAAMALTTAAYGLYLRARERPLLLLPVLVLPPLLSLLYGTILMATIPRSRFVREIPLEELREEDILAEPVEGFPKKVIERGDVERLRKLGIERMKILTNLPRMGPFLFLVLLLMEVRPDPSLLFTSPVQALFLLF
ncbi:MAG: prepilin peptidase [Candidatus Diapherotrites archaeon]|nr:prepilin peptidase [Candidatus Diapherotrites archaeon]